MLKEKIIIITGATGGIGSAIARRFAAEGAQLAITAQSQPALEALASELTRNYGRDILVHTGDVADVNSVASLYASIFKRFSRLDGLVANAGILGDGLLGMLAEKNMHQTLNTNVMGTLHHLQAASRLMQRNRSGSIIVTSSIIGRQGNRGQTVYAASKAALIGATLSAAKELGPHGIRVNALAPGVIETPMIAHLDTDTRRERLEHIALGRFGVPDDVAKAALFLASDMASYVSGQILGVDGAMVI